MQDNSPTRLHLGCGTKKLEGWVNVDSVLSCHPDLRHDLADPLPYKDLSVDEILAEDLLEHFDKYYRYFVFYDWARVLKIGGKITLQVPNFRKIVYRYFKLSFDNFLDLVFGENLLAAKHYLSHFGNHKWGYSTKSLTAFVSRLGIGNIKIKEDCLNIRLTGSKIRHVAKEEVENFRVFSAANKGVSGKDFVTLKEAKKAIEELGN